MRSISNTHSIFSSPAFVCALLLLLANDFYFKSQYSNWLTGKLSDFAGLYVFVQFVAAVCRVRVLRVAIISGFLFVLWKSDISSPFIVWWNVNLPIKINRVSDPTDLIALTILPLAVRWYSIANYSYWQFLKYPVGALALFSIMATSTVMPRYDIKLDLQNRSKDLPSSANQAYEDLDSILVPQGLKCVSCEKNEPYREYRDGDIVARFNYDVTSGVLYVSLETHKPSLSTKKVNELQAELMSKLSGRFENITIRKESWPESVSKIPERVITLSFPRVGLPFTCYKDGINNPEVVKALQLVNEFVSAKADEINGGSPYFHGCKVDPNISCAENDVCQDVRLGRVVGASRFDRSVALETLVLTTTIYIRFSGLTGTPDEIDNLSKELMEHFKNSLNPDVEMTTEKRNY